MKTFTIIEHHKRIADEQWSGNLEVLTAHYRDALDSGNSWDERITRKPKTIKRLVRNLNSIYSEICPSDFVTIAINI